VPVKLNNLQTSIDVQFSESYFRILIELISTDIFIFFQNFTESFSFDHICEFPRRYAEDSQLIKAKQST